jgi:hypothetical protein
MVGCNKSTIQRLERQERRTGRATPGPMVRKKLFEILGVTL